MAPLETDPSIDASFHYGEDVCRARDEAAGLRSEVCQLRVRMEEIEEERNFNAAKANEFQDILSTFKKEHVHEELVKKSLQVAEMSMSLDSLKSQIRTLTAENEKLRNASAEDRSKMTDLSGVVRSLQGYASCESDEEDEDEEEVVLTAEKALDMTLKNMKFHIEVLEDELQDRSVKCKDQERKIAKLEKESDLKNLKVEMLEELFRSLNHQERIDESPTKPQLAKANSSPDLFKNGKPLSTRARPRRSARATPASLKGGREKIIIKAGGIEGAYTGPLKDGKPNGTGTIRFTNGDTYLGEVADGKMHGKGTLYRSSRAGSGISRGMFENNEFMV
jgi:hypothetical protein